MPPKQFTKEDIEKAEKLIKLEESPALAVFDELSDVNVALQELIHAVNASRTTEISIDNPQDLIVDLEPLESKIGDLQDKISDVIDTIKDIKEVDLSGVEKLLKTISSKESKEIDLSELANISDILESVLVAVQITAGEASKEKEQLKPDLQEIQKILDVINENIVAIDIPNFDYLKLAKIIKDNVNISVSGGGGGINKHLLNSSGTVINPATSDKQDNVINELQSMVGFDIPAYDYIALTYVAAGNGAGEIETVVFKTGGSGGTTVGTLTLAYDASDNISSVTKT